MGLCLSCLYSNEALLQKQLEKSDKNIKCFSFCNYECLAKIVHVYDGDTVHLVIPQENTKTLIKLKARLYGIDTPEMRIQEQKESAIKFFSSIGHLIPCTHCSQHCLEYTHRNPPNVDNKQSLIDWVYNFHNEVNVRLGKPYYSKQKLKNKYDEVAFCKS